LQDKLSRASFLDPSQISTDSVSFGCTVTVKVLVFDDTEEFSLVGAGEDDPNNGKINVSSPLAQGLIGKKVGKGGQAPWRRRYSRCHTIFAPRS
jgi:transcription elongation factor GreA